MTAPLPTVTVIVPSFNSLTTIQETLDSLTAQTYVPDEVIVIDDGSSDGTPAFVSSYSPEVKLLNQDHSGPSEARNLGIAHATGDWIAFLDADDVWHPHKLADQVDVLTSHPHLDLVATTWTRSSPQPVADPAITWLSYLDLLRMNQFQTSTVLANKTALEEVGGFRSHLDSVEDWDLWMRLSRRHSLAILESPLVMYRDSPQGVSKQLRTFVSAMNTMLAEEAIRTDLSHQEFSTLWAWHRERLALALLLIGDTRGSLTTLAGLRQEGPRAAWRATKDHTAPYLVSRLKRRIR
jgi:glycosyltransferase involved in cell wall biosynthesis